MIFLVFLGFALPESLIWISQWQGWAHVVYAAGVPIDTIPATYDPTQIIDSVLRSELQVRSRRIQSGSTGEGLIPDITIPVKLPGFGNLEETSSLQISGSQRISFGGSQNYTTNPTIRETQGVSTFPELKLDQALTLNLTGTIGRKITVFIDHNSEVQDNTKNTIRLQYKGDEDEIVKLLEAGNTELRLPLTMTYAQFSAGGASKRGLFGLRGEMQFGPLQMAFVATRQQGQTQSTQIQRGGQVVVDTLYGKDYVRDRFFWLGETRPIQDLWVFLDDQNGANNQSLGARIGRACFMDLDGTMDVTDCESGYFHPLYASSGDYVFYRSSNVIELSAPPTRFILGVVYVTEDGDTVGRIGEDQDTLVLRLIRPQTPTIENGTHRDSVLWFLQMRNVYSLYPPGQQVSNIQVSILRDSSGVLVSGERGQTYLQIFGLDPDGDNIINETVLREGNPITVLDRSRGLLFFPDPLPFVRGDLAEPDSSLYFQDNIQPGEGTTYRLVVRYISIQREYQLPFNVIEGSVQVTAGGRVLQEGQDYEVDYDFGVVRIINPDLLQDSSLTLNISYDYGEALSLMQTSLMGLSLFTTSPDSSLSLAGVVLYRGQSTRDLRPSWDGGPGRNLVTDFRLEGAFSPLWMRRIQDLFPSSVLRSPQPSKGPLTLSLEVARSFPNPNTLGRAFIDDMEGRSLTLSFPVTYHRAWKWGSVPEDRDTSELARRVFWATPDNFFLRGDIYPNLPTPQQRNERAPVLMWVADPIHPGSTANWASLNTVLDVVGVNLESYEFLDVVLQGDQGVLWVDLATNLNENGIRRNCRGEIVGMDPVLETEDKNLNGVLDPGEDVGLDGVAGKDEDQVAGDDCNDDYRFDLEDYSRASGTEGNGGYPDTEDLNDNWQLDLSSDYISFPIPLDSTLYDVYGVRPYAVVNGWKFYRIPIRSELRRTYGERFNENAVRFGRLRWEDFRQKDTLFIAQIDVIGNDWRRWRIESQTDSLPIDTTVERLAVGTVSTDETPDYTPPPDAVRLRLADGTLESERSTSVVVENLRPGHVALVYRPLGSQKQNYRNYKRLKVWVRPRPTASPPYGTFVMRIGSDSTHYYEVRKSLNTNAWIPLEVDLDFLPHLKDSLRRAGGGDTLHYGSFTIVGSPNLHAVGYLFLGLANTTSQDLSLEIWVDDIQLLDPRTKAGNAMNASVDVNLNPLFSASIQGNYTDDDFVRFEGREPGYETQQSYTYQISSSPLDALWVSSPARLQLRYSYGWNRSFPRYAPDTDLLLSGDLTQRFETVQDQSDFSASLSFSPLLGAVTLPSWTYNRRQNASRGPYNQIFAFSQNLSSQWNLMIQRRGWSRWDVRLWPTQVGLNAAYSENRSQSWDGRSNTNIAQWKWYYDIGGSVQLQPIRNLSGSYGRSHRLAGYLAGGVRNPRDIPELSMNENYSLQWNLSFKRITVTPRFQNTYTENRSEDPLILQTGLRTVSLNQSLGGSIFLPTSSVFRWITGWVVRAISDSSQKVGSPRWLFSQIQQSLDRLDVSVNLQYNQRFNAQNVEGRPDWRYRLGLDVKRIPAYDDQTYAEARSTTLSFGNLSLNLMRVQITFRPSWTWDRNFTASLATFTDRKTWPSVSFSTTLIRPPFPLPPSWQLVNMSLTGQYDVTQNVRGTLVPEKTVENTDNTRSRQITVNGTLRNGMALSVNWMDNLTRSLSQGAGSAAENISRSSSWGGQVRYTFRNPRGFPIPLSDQRIFRLKGNVDLTFSLERGHDRTEANGRPLSENWRHKWSLTGSYRFRNGVDANLTLSRQETRDLSENVNGSTTIQLDVNFRF